jgi:hypothetical protein
MAVTNKCLARSNKSPHRANATKNRCSVDDTETPAQPAEPSAAGPEGRRAGEPNHPPAADPLTEAYRKGANAKTTGHGRRAIPGEYRDASKVRE